MVYFQTVTSNC